MNLKAVYQKYKRVLQPVLYCKNRVFGFRIHNKGQNNTVEGIGNCRAKGVTISVYGSCNRIVIGDMSSLFDVNISIHGSNNTVLLGKRSFLLGASFAIEDDGNVIQTGEHTYIYNNTEISAIESTTVTIGEDCLFSGNIMIRSGDSHVLLDRTSGRRINFSKDISIGNHVWLGNGCKVLKGSVIENGCVGGTGAVITSGTVREENAVLAGMPAKVVRRDVDWKQSRK